MTQPPQPAPDRGPGAHGAPGGPEAPAAPPHRYTAQLASEIEARWQGRWEAEGAFRQPNPGEPGFDAAKPKFYCLDMFPYPSGAGLHVGHPEGYTATDILCRYKRMCGFNVLHPMGWDAFGLPAEQYAIQTGVHPSETTRAAIDNFRRQLKRFGFSYDWSRELGTIDEDYYKWTQWIFLQIYNAWYDPRADRARPIAELIGELESGDLRIGPDGELAHIGEPARALEGLGGEPGVYRRWHELSADAQREVIDGQRLAYVGEQVVNWCPKLGTALANEEVIDGRSERGGHPVKRTPLRQWMFRITAYAERLLAGLADVEWPQSTRTQQAEWIGRSEGAEVEFALEDVVGRQSLPTGGPAAAGHSSHPLNRDERLSIRAEGFVARDPYPPGQAAPRDLMATIRKLPHLELPGATYFVTWRTKEGVRMDAGARRVVLDALRHFHGDRCDTYACCVMPDHVHWIVRPYEGRRLGDLVASVKHFSARQANPGLGREGALWQEEHFDHIVRDGDWFGAFLMYIAQNPVTDGLVSTATEYDALYVSDKVKLIDGKPIAFAPPDPEPFDPEQALKSRQGLPTYLRVFTTRPDTLFGATYMVVAPEHPVIDAVLVRPRPETPTAELRAYVEAARNRSDVERQESKEKTGCFTGLQAINPATGERIPVWCADYVLMGYGFGAIMAVPAHDERDFEFAETFDLPIRDVVHTRQQAAIAFITRHATTEERDDTRWIATLADFMGITTSHDMAPSRFGEALNILRERRLGRAVGATIQLTPPKQARAGAPGSVGERRGATRATWMEVVDSLGMTTWAAADAILRQQRQCANQGEANESPGYAANSSNSEVTLDGLPTEQAKGRIIAWLEDKGIGRRKVTYRLRDWLFSRQRYWGEPFPIVWDDRGNHHPVDASALPVTLPPLSDYAPPESDEPVPLLAKAAGWVSTTAQEAGVSALAPEARVQRETNTMPGWAGSCWYYLRFCDPKNDERFVGQEAERYWMGAGEGGRGGVDLYIGGAEHAVLHLLYARFWHAALYDLGHISTPEPFGRLFHQGLITSHAYQDGTGRLIPVDEVEQRDDRFVLKATGEEVRQIVAKMSKALKNVVNPDDVIAEFGADTFRLYEMYMGPLEASKPWDTRAISGLFRFLQRSWRLLIDEQTGDVKLADAPDGDLEKKLHRMIAKVGADIEQLAFNTAIAAMIEFVNAATSAGEAGAALTRDQAERFALALAPFAPHMGEELALRLGRETMVSTTGAWPQVDESMLRDDEVEIAVQLLGKVRVRIMAPADADEDQLREFAMAHPDVQALVEGKTVRKVIAVPGRLVNIVAG